MPDSLPKFSQFSFLLLLALLSSSCSFSPLFDREVMLHSCDEWSSFKLGEYELHNNVWGKGDINVFTQCIYAQQGGDTKMMGWSWVWPKTNHNVRAYPSVLYGYKPWGGYSTTDKLPLRLADVATLRASYAVEEESDGMVNLLLEAWITNSAAPNAYHRTHELAIHMHQRDWPGQTGAFIESVVFDGIEYDFYRNAAINVPGDDHSWAYLGFVQKGRPVFEADVDIKKFIDYLMQRDYISPDEFVVSVELGNEIISGRGKMNISHYQVDVTSKN